MSALKQFKVENIFGHSEIVCQLRGSLSVAFPFDRYSS